MFYYQFVDFTILVFIGRQRDKQNYKKKFRLKMSGEESESERKRQMKPVKVRQGKHKL